MLRRIAAVLLTLASLAGAADAQNASTEERLRDQLRQTTLQLREAQDSMAELKTQLETANQQVEAQRTALAAGAAKPAEAPQSQELRRAVAERSQQLEASQEQFEASQKLLGQWQGAYAQAAALAKARDADAKKFEALYQETKTKNETCFKDNAELARIGNELLTRYKQKGVLDTLGSKEPITQIHRVRLETLAQDYHIAIQDHTVDPSTPPGAATPR